MKSEQKRWSMQKILPLQLWEMQVARHGGWVQPKKVSNHVGPTYPTLWGMASFATKTWRHLWESFFLVQPLVSNTSKRTWMKSHHPFYMASKWECQGCPEVLTCGRSIWAIQYPLYQKARKAWEYSNHIWRKMIFFCCEGPLNLMYHVSAALLEVCEEAKNVNGKK